MRSLYRAALAAAFALVCSTAAPAQVVGSVPVISADRAASGSVTTTGATSCPAAGGTGCIVLNAPGAASALATISGTWVGQQEFDCQKPDGTWVPINGVPYPSGGLAATTSVTNGTWAFQYTGCQSLRVYANSLGSGTAAVSWWASADPLQLVFPTLPFAPPTGVNLQTWGGMNVLFGPGPSFVPGTGAAPRMALTGDSILGNTNRVGYHTTLGPTIPTAAGSLAAIEADATNKVRLRYIKVCLGVGALQTTATERLLVLYRTTAASSGGATVVPTIYESASDVAFAGVLRAGAITTTPAIGSVAIANSLWSATFAFTTASTTTTPQCAEKYFDTGQMKPITIAAGTGNGLALGDLSGGSGGAGVYNIDLGWSVELN